MSRTEHARLVVAVHAVDSARHAVEPVLRRRLPEVRFVNILDEGLWILAQEPTVSAAARRRFRSIMTLAASLQPDAILTTCTAYSSVALAMQSRFPEAPIVPIDLPMVEEAIAIGSTIGILGTLEVGVREQLRLLLTTANKAGRSVRTIPRVCPDAFQAFQRGDADAHDQILLGALRSFPADTEVVLLAQASLAYLVDSVPGDLGVPVLASPALAADRLGSLLGFEL